MANLGLSVHQGHHSLVAPHSGTTVQVLVGHNEPDPTLHLEAATEVRTLTCPGCVLHHQFGGTALPTTRGLGQPELTDTPVAIDALAPFARVPSAIRTRGPPSC